MDESAFHYLCRQDPDVFNAPSLRLQVRRLQDMVIAEFEQGRTDANSVRTYVAENYGGNGIGSEEEVLIKVLLLKEIIIHTWAWWRTYGPGKTSTKNT
jgi:hypothetical protein